MTKQEALKLVQKWELDYEEFLKNDPDAKDLHKGNLYNRHLDSCWRTTEELDFEDYKAARKKDIDDSGKYCYDDMIYYIIKMPVDELLNVCTKTEAKPFYPLLVEVLKKHNVKYVIGAAIVDMDCVENYNYPPIFVTWLEVPVFPNDINVAHEIGRAIHSETGDSDSYDGYRGKVTKFAGYELD